MAEPVDPADDWAVTRGARRAVSYAAFDPAADAHATSVECVGVRGPVTTAWDGGRAVPAAEWTITGTAGTPVTRSLVVDGSDVWVVQSVESDPASRTVHRCQCVKG